MEKINVAELLRNCPKGMKLDCYLFNGLEFDHIDTDNENYPIVCRAKDSTGEYYTHTFTKYGWYTSSYDYSKCVIFPKGKTTWEGFNRPFKDGDVVAFDYTLGTQVFIVKKYTVHSGYAQCYMMLDYDGEINFENRGYFVHRFATKEEKQKLFNAIKENGYRWNEETKTLEKLIQPKFKVGDRIRKIGELSTYTISDIKDSHYFCGNYLICDTFDTDWELVPDKFDINTLKPFDKVLVRGGAGQKWTIDFFSFMDKDAAYSFICVGHYVTQCIPYKGNEHLLGTTNDCDKYFKNW